MKPKLNTTWREQWGLFSTYLGNAWISNGTMAIITRELKKPVPDEIKHNPTSSFDLDKGMAGVIAQYLPKAKPGKVKCTFMNPHDDNPPGYVVFTGPRGLQVVGNLAVYEFIIRRIKGFTRVELTSESGPIFFFRDNSMVALMMPYTVQKHYVERLNKAIKEAA